jgi:hypothetical protein
MFTLILLAIVPNAYAFFDTKLNVHECKNINDVATCSNTCNLVSNRHVVFKVDEKTSSVFRDDYLNNKKEQMISIKNCKIINKKNWYCEETFKVGSEKSTIIQYMTDGIHVYKLNIGNELVKLSCSK